MAVIHNPARSHNGFVQIIVPVSLMALCGIILATLYTGHRISLYLETLRERASNTALLYSAARRVAVALDTSSDNLKSKIAAARSYSLRVGNSTVLVSVDGESGKINPLIVSQAILDRYIDELELPLDTIDTLQSRLSAARAANNQSEADKAVYSVLIPRIPLAQLRSDFTTLVSLPGIDTSGAHL